MNCCDGKGKQEPRAARLVGMTEGPRRWWLLAAVAVVGGLALGWEQLVILGVAPVLISVMPCLLMCGLGLCMMKRKEKTLASSEPLQHADSVTQPKDAVTLVRSSGKEGA